jgi:tryptophan synthase alpha subunit
MERGIGGRIEDAFASAKERGEAAFVTFVTAGYPTKEGMFHVSGIFVLADGEPSKQE